MKKVIIIVFLIALSIGGYVVFTQYSKNNNELLFSGNIDVREVRLGFRLGGKIDILLVDEGSVVKKGDILAKLEQTPYLDRLRIVQSELSANESVVNNARINYNRAKNLADNGAGPIKARDDAQSYLNEASSRLSTTKAREIQAKNEVEDTILIAPSDGVIISRVLETGSIIQQGATLYTLSLSNPVFARIYLPLKDLELLQSGMKLKVKTDSGQEYNGTVGYISPTAEFTPKSVETKSLRTDLVYRVKILIENPDSKLKQGMPITIALSKKA